MKFMQAVRLLSWLLATAVIIVTAGQVPDVGVTNWEPVLQSHIWTCVLFYDRLDDRYLQDWQELMSSLDDVFATNDRVGFAMLDIRAHPYYRAQYKYFDDPDPFIKSFYESFPAHADDLLKISYANFMNLQGDLYWPARVALFANDWNVYGEVDMDFNSQVQAKVGIMTRWIESTVHKEPDTLKVLMTSQVNREQKRATENQDVDNSFTFTKYFTMKENQKNNKPTASLAAQENQRFLLESGSYNNQQLGESMTYFKYDNITINSRKDSESFLDALALVIDKYLIWVEAYETLWDDARRQREDEQTNFGVYLHEMNQKVRALIDNIFGESYVAPDRKFDNDPFYLGKTDEEISSARQRRHQVPTALKLYLDEMVFGYGRSPASLRRYIKKDVADKLGATPEERRRARKTAQTSDFAMFQRMRDYMKIVEDVQLTEDQYLNVLADLTTQWHNILVQFQDNLNEYYVETYLAQNPLSDYKFHHKPIDVIDMEDPANAELLSDYEEFNRRYTLPAVPVVLANVNMTDHEYTLDYLVEQCGSMEIADNIRVSNPVGEKSTSGWGGLDKYVLDDSLLNKSRKRTYYDEDGDEVDSVDRDITLEQFIILSQKLGNLYLHDHSLPDACDSILYNHTLYGEGQKFRIPHVVAAYDLFHRVTMYNYARSWPSLFIGKKGSNSKVHVDAGASGFFMYLVSGRKRWMVYNPAERPFLYDRIHQHAFLPDVLGMDKSDEANEYLSKRFPLLRRAEDAYEIIQEPGQLIYIPPDSPHAVENLDDIVGVALNLSPRDAFANHLHDQIHGDRKFGYTELALKYWLFEDNAQTPMKSKDPLYLTFGEYKAQY